MKFIVLLLIAIASVATAAPLPAGLTRFNPAGLAENWVFEGTAFAAEPAAGPKGIAVHRLAHPVRGHFLTVSAEEQAVAQRAGFTAEGTAFFAAPEGNPVYRYQDGAGHYYYGLKGQEPPAGSWKLEGMAFKVPARGEPVWRYRDGGSGRYLFTRGEESPYQVGAYYFPSFSGSAKIIIDGTKRVHGRSDWWGGVADFYGKQPGVAADRRGWDGNFDALKPAIGYYDQANVGTLEKHIRQASDAGLSFFSFYWYWSGKKGGELLPEALKSYLAAPNSHQLKFNLALYAHPWDEDMAIAPAQEDQVIAQLVRYFADPRYLKLPDRRPVFVVGDLRNIRNSDGRKCDDRQCHVQSTGSFIAKLRRAARERNGIEPFVQLQPAPGWDGVKEADGVTCLVPPVTIAGGTPYPRIDESVYDVLARPGKPVSPCMLQNFDERPRQDIAVANRAAIRYLQGKTDSQFRSNLMAARRFSDAAWAKRHDPSSRLIYLYAWNEWHEGGVLEPNAQTGARDLNIVTDVFQLPRAPSPCLDAGRCDSGRAEPRK